MERIGAKFEGILRAHRLAVDGIPRDYGEVFYFSGRMASVKMHLEQLLERK